MPEQAVKTVLKKAVRVASDWTRRMAFFSKGQNSRGMRERAMERKRTNGRKKRTPPSASEMDALDDERW